MLWSASLRNSHNIVALILPMWVLGLTMYIIALAIALWGAFGIEELSAPADSLRWTRTVLKWSRTIEIPLSEILEVKAVTPWYGMDNTVQVSTAGKQLRIGKKLLRDEALDIEGHLRHAVGLGR
jgi:hypothetical protein